MFLLRYFWFKILNLYFICMCPPVISILCASPRDCHGSPGSSVPGFSPRQEYWEWFLFQRFSGDLQTQDWTCISCIYTLWLDSLPTELPPGKPLYILYMYSNISNNSFDNNCHKIKLFINSVCCILFLLFGVCPVLCILFGDIYFHVLLKL